MSEHVAHPPDCHCRECWEDGNVRKYLEAQAQAVPALATAKKFDSAKPRTDLLPADALLGAARAFGYGAKKYADWNYLKGDGLPWGKMLGAAFRHLLAWSLGEDIDEESKLHHLDLAAAEVLMLSAAVKRGRGLDDRWKP